MTREEITADGPPTHMTAWTVAGRPGGPGRLQLASRPVPSPAPDEVVIAVSACGVCRTDLHLAEGELRARGPARVPGHEVVGRVAARGADAVRFASGDRVGIAWLRRTCGGCRWCRSGRENLCRSSQYTGWDADGGFAGYAAVSVPSLLFLLYLPAVLFLLREPNAEIDDR